MFSLSVRNDTEMGARGGGGGATEIKEEITLGSPDIFFTEKAGVRNSNKFYLQLPQ